METKHTPGPWFVMGIDGNGDIQVSGHPFYIGHSDPLYHCIVTGNNEAERKANAALIAAAPETAAERDRLAAINAELVAALERILYAHDNHGNGAAMGEAILCQQYAAQARAALAKSK